MPGCQSTGCGTGLTCSSSDGRCLPSMGSNALGATCSVDSDCQSGYCEFFTGGGICVATCSASGQCPDGFVCADFGGGGLCLSSSFVYGSAFTPGTEGVAEACTRPSQDTTSQCHSNFYCQASAGQAGVCTDSCGVDADCQATGEGLDGGWLCRVGTVNLGSWPDGGSDRVRQDFCSGPWPSPGQTCSTDADCGGFAGSCSSGFCSSNFGSGCSSDSACDHGYCFPGATRSFCTEPCCSYYLCPGASTCSPVLGPAGEAFKVCVDYPANANSAPGDTCDPANPTTCFTDLCFVDPNSPDGGGYCSTTCCSDQDCAFMPGTSCRLLPNGLTYPDGGSAGFASYCVLL